jgi:hypothetical protein
MPDKSMIQFKPIHRQLATIVQLETEAKRMQRERERETLGRKKKEGMCRETKGN